MKPPCELISKFLLPTVRAIIAGELIENHGFTQSDAALKLGLIQSAMSRYITLERGGKIDSIKKIRSLTEALAKNIAESKLSQEEIILKMCAICTTFRKNRGLCKLHRHIAPNLSEKCNICARVSMIC